MIFKWLRSFLALAVATAVVTFLLDVLLFPKELHLQKLPMLVVFYVLGISLILFYQKWVEQREVQEGKDYYNVKNEAFILGLYLGLLSGGTHIINTPQADLSLILRNILFYGLAGYLFGRAMRGKTPGLDQGSKGRKNEQRAGKKKRK